MPLVSYQKMICAALQSFNISLWLKRGNIRKGRRLWFTRRISLLITVEIMSCLLVQLLYIVIANGSMEGQVMPDYKSWMCSVYLLHNKHIVGTIVISEGWSVNEKNIGHRCLQEFSWKH